MNNFCPSFWFDKLLEYLFPPGTPDYMDTSVILRVDPEGPYYAMGVRNSFGLAIDPVTGAYVDPRMAELLLDLHEMF